MKTKNAGKLRCSEVAKYVCEHLDEEIDSPKCRAIKQHLQTCKTCPKDLADVKKVITLYRRESVPRLTQDVEKQLFAVLKLEQ